MKFHFALIPLLIAVASCGPSGKTETTSTVDSTKVAAQDTTTTPVADPATQQETSAKEEAKEEDEGEQKSGPGYPGSQQAFELTFFGFSPDLSTTAFEMKGSFDGGYNSAIEFYVIKVDKNDYAASPYRIATDAESDYNMDSVQTVVNNKVKQYKLSNTGYEKFDLSVSKTITIKGEKYNLQFIQIAIPDVPTETDYNTGEVTRRGVMKFELDLIQASTGKTWVLQKDKTLPKSRGSVKRYRLKEAYVQGGKIAVMIEMDLEAVKDVESYYSYATTYMMVTGSVEQ